MDFIVSNSGVASVNAYTGYKNNTFNINFVNQEYDEIDYSDIGKLKPIAGDYETNLKFFNDKLMNAFVWAFSKKDVVSIYAGVSADSLPIAEKGLYEGVYKVILYVGSCLLTGEKIDFKKIQSTLGKGFIKSFSGDGIKKLTQPWLDSLKSIRGKVPGVGDEALGKLAKYSKFVKNGFSNGLSYAGELGLTFGIDYIATIFSNVAGAVISGKPITLDSLALGSSFLKCSTKIICQFAGKLIGGDTGKAVGTAVGAMIGEYQVKFFTDGNGNIDEAACAIAGASQLAGAAVAIIVVCAIFNPAAWVVGVVALAGAAVGFFAYALIYNYDKICSTMYNIFMGVCDFVSRPLDIVAGWAMSSIDNIANSVVNMFVGGIDFISNLFSSGALKLYNVVSNIGVSSGAIVSNGFGSLISESMNLSNNEVSYNNGNVDLCIGWAS